MKLLILALETNSFTVQAGNVFEVSEKCVSEVVRMEKPLNTQTFMSKNVVVS